MFFPVVIVFGLTLAFAAAAGKARASDRARVADEDRYAPPPPAKKLPRGLTPEYVALAKKFATYHKLPLQWVLQTILVESGGNPRATGDEGKSYGLMQVNHVAHAALLKKLGLTKERLFEPAINIALGTYLMRQFVNDLLALLKKYPSKAPLDEILRLAYKGPKYVKDAIVKGRDPRTIAWAPPALARWQDARVATQAVA